MYFIHCWNDDKKVMAPKAQPHYGVLAELTGLTKYPIMFGFTHIDISAENISEFIDQKLFGKLKEYKHVGVWETTEDYACFAMYFWSIVLGYIRSGGDMNNIKDPDVVQAINMIKKNKSWTGCNVPNEIDLLICYARDARCILELDREGFEYDTDYVIDILSDYDLFGRQSTLGFKTNIRDPYKKNFIK